MLGRQARVHSLGFRSSFIFSVLRAIVVRPRGVHTAVDDLMSCSASFQTSKLAYSMGLPSTPRTGACLLASFTRICIRDEDAVRPVDAWELEPRLEEADEERVLDRTLGAASDGTGVAEAAEVPGPCFMTASGWLMWCRCSTMRPPSVDAVHERLMRCSGSRWAAAAAAAYGELDGEAHRFWFHTIRMDVEHGAQIARSTSRRESCVRPLSFGQNGPDKLG